MLIDQDSPSLVAAPKKRPVLKTAGGPAPVPGAPARNPQAPATPGVMPAPAGAIRPVNAPSPGGVGIVPPPAPSASPVAAASAPGVAPAPNPLATSQSPIGGEPLPPPAPGGSPLPIRGVSMTSFGPGNDLRGTQIAPSNTINRTALAQQALTDFDQANARGLQERFQATGQRAAALGRLGMGSVAREVRDVGTEYDLGRQRYANELARGLAEAEVGDARADRSELRGERGYQSDLAREALENRLRERLTQESLLNSRFGRDMGRWSVGSSNNPSQMELGAADSLNGVAAGAFGGMQGLLMEMARRRAQQPAQAPPAPPTGTRLPDPLALPGNVG